MCILQSDSPLDMWNMDVAWESWTSTWLFENGEDTHQLRDDIWQPLIWEEYLKWEENTCQHLILDDNEHGTCDATCHLANGDVLG